MSDPDDSKAPDVGGAPSNAFAADFLSLLAEEEQLQSAIAREEQEDWLVPWPVEATADDMWAVLPPGQSLGRGDQPVGRFNEKRLAEMFAFILPAAQREPRYTLGEEPEEEKGFPLYDRGAPVGHLQERDAEWLLKMNLFDAIGSSPRAMSWFLANAGDTVLEQTGEISLARVLALERQMRGE
jgi:hypothetical protein